MPLPTPASGTRHLSQSLLGVHAQLSKETFDPTNPNHIEAYRMLVYEGRQHPTLRFTLEHPYLDVRAMMTDKIVRMYLDNPSGNVHVRSV